jgi:hypothetical protein
MKKEKIEVDLSAASHQDQSCIVDVVVPIDE